MKKYTWKIAKGVLAGACVTLISAGSAFAAEPILTEQGAGVSAGYVGQGYEDPALAEKHREIDAYIFEQGGLEKFNDMGFTVTHTGPMAGKIEIGITPYDDSFANELYALFGDDEVNVVEGVQAITFMPEPALDEGGFSTMVVGGPEPGEGEVAITVTDPLPAVDPDTPVSSTDDAGTAVDAELIYAPVEPDAAVSDEDAASSDAGDAGAGAEVPEMAPIAAPAESTAADAIAPTSQSQTQSSSMLWAWIAGGVAALGAVALFIRRAVGAKK